MTVSEIFYHSFQSGSDHLALAAVAEMSLIRDALEFLKPLHGSHPFRCVGKTSCSN